jgi:hypothetical protein
LRYVRESAEALDYLYEQGLVHRDVKPPNLLYVDGHVKLAEPGLGQAAMPADRGSGSVAGTEPYMPREAWQGKATRATDLFGLAVTYAELCLGEPLHPEGDQRQTWLPVLGQKPDLSALSRAERRVLGRALHPDPSKRYASCLAFALALERAANAEPLVRYWVTGLRLLLGFRPRTAGAPADDDKLDRPGEDQVSPQESAALGSVLAAPSDVSDRRAAGAWAANAALPAAERRAAPPSPQAAQPQTRLRGSILAVVVLSIGVCVCGLVVWARRHTDPELGAAPLARAVRARLVTNDFQGALDELQTEPARGCPEEERNSLRNEVREAWLRRVRDLTREDDPQHKRQALALLEQLLRSEPFRDDREARARRASLVEDLLELDPERLARLGRAYATMGDCLMREPYWPGVGPGTGDPGKEALAAYSRANPSDATRPDDFVQRGYAATRAARPDWDQIETDIREAEKANGDKPSWASRGLAAYVALLRSLERVNPKEREQYLRASVASYEQAVALVPRLSKATQFLPALLTGRSMAYSELARCVPDRPERRALLGRALADAKAVIDGSATNLEKAHAQCALGSALESSACLLGDESDKNYEGAVSAFRSAWNAVNLPWFHCCQGRALYKWAASGDLGGRSGWLDNDPTGEAMKERRARLKEAIKELHAGEKCPDPASRVQSLYWLAHCYVLMSTYDEAGSALETAAAVAAQEELSALAACHIALGDLDLYRFVDAGPAGKDDPAISRLPQQARRWAARTGGALPLDADRVTGQSYLLDGDWSNAVRAFERHAPQRPAGADSAADVPLLLGHVKCRVQLAAENAAGFRELRQLLSRAVELHERGGSRRASFYADIAATFVRIADAAPEEDQAEPRLESCVAFETAIALAPLDRDRWAWHRGAATQYMNLRSRVALPAHKADYSAKAQEHLKQALRSASPSERESLQNLQKSLDALGPAPPPRK